MQKACTILAFPRIYLAPSECRPALTARKYLYPALDPMSWPLNLCDPLVANMQASVANHDRQPVTDAFYACSQKAGALVTADQAWALLETKLASRYSTVRRAFIELDQDKDGVINMKEFRHSLEVRTCMTTVLLRGFWLHHAVADTKL